MTTFRTRPAITGRAARDGRAIGGPQAPPPGDRLRRILGRHAAPREPPSAASARWFLLAWLLAFIILAANAPGRMIFNTKLGVDIDPAGFYARPMAPVEPAGMVRDAAEPVHRLRGADGTVLSGWPAAAPAGVDHRAAVAVAACRAWLLGYGAARHGAADRIAGFPAARRRHVRPVADVHYRHRVDLGCRAARHPRAMGAATAHIGGGTWLRRGRGRQVRRRGVVHGRGQRGLHDRRAHASCLVHPDPHTQQAARFARPLVERSGSSGDELVADPAAAPGRLLIQLPALRRAGRHHHEDHVGYRVPARRGQLDRLFQSRRARGCPLAGR